MGVAIEIGNYITWLWGRNSSNVTLANTINLPVGDDGYHLFMVILGLFYYWVYHITHHKVQDEYSRDTCAMVKLRCR